MRPHIMKKRCAVCGTEKEFWKFFTSIAFGSPDLDMRPSEMTRSTIGSWVEECPNCGYCSSDIRKASDQVKAIVWLPKYRQQLSDSSMPELANSFLCKAILDESSGDYASASWALIHAAWACDDDEKPESAKKCRNRAVDMIFKAIQAGQEFTKEDGVRTAILIDLLRRCGRFSEAKQLIAKERNNIKEDRILKVLAFQEILINRADVDCHTIGEAIGDE